MKDRPIRQLVLEGDATQRGIVHGAAYHNEIRIYAEERVRLSANGSWAGRQANREDALALADKMLTAHRDYDADLYDEMVAMANSSGISAAEAVIVGGFTDFVDVVRALGGTGLAEEDDCTAVIVPDQAAGGRGCYAQTWDMPDTATDHVTRLRVRQASRPEALIFSTVGCLGQIGMNEAGICVGINNLTANNGRIGVTWPFVVRKALGASSIEQALAAVLEADLAGAHNYLLFDRYGAGFNVEAMPEYRAVTSLDQDPLVHTNHCLDEKAQELEAPRSPDLVASSLARLQTANAILGQQIAAGGPIGPEDLIALTREPQAICRRSEPPHHTESSGAAIMRPATGEFWACWGIPADNEFERFSV
ncbi:MAG: C45 family autoproteolytic acyltransferase/hydrolase [Actinomycetota bacterium]